MTQLKTFLATAAAATLSSVLQAAEAGPPREMPSFSRATEWINSPALTGAALRGKVVVVQFWTFTCINWLRTLPYIRAWAEKYEPQGLVVVGVHSPEFEVEKDLQEVRRAVSELRVAHPVAIDNDFAVWRAYNNRYWPALYVVDAQGRIRHHQFGEGGYEKTEKVIQRVLVEAGNAGVPRGLVAVDGRGVEAAADWESLRSPETYVGSERAENFASAGGISEGRRLFAAPSRLPLNHWALSGDWTMGRRGVSPNKANARIVYRFHARDLHLVMRGAGGSPVRMRVLLDGRPPGAAHGLDVDVNGSGVVTGPRLYQLIRQSPPILDRLFEIEFFDPGVEVFVFTFG